MVCRSYTGPAAAPSAPRSITKPFKACNIIRVESHQRELESEVLALGSGGGPQDGRVSLERSGDLMKGTAAHDLKSHSLEVGFNMRSAQGRKGHLRFVVCLLPWLLAAPLIGQDQGDAPGRAARLSFKSGNVTLQPSGETDWSQVDLNYTLTTGDRLYTDQGARAELEVGPFAVRMSDATDLTMANLNDQLMQLGIGQGSVRVSVFELPAGNTVEIDTPNGALTAQGAGSYRVDVDPNNGTRVIVNSGSLELTGGGANQTIMAGQAVQLTGTGPIQVNSIEFPGEDGFDQWCQGRDHRIQSFRSRQYVNPYVPGAEDLDQYGQWGSDPQYGPVWYPSAVAVGWVPYRFGHWVWITPWGWTWVDDAPWGYCPFHYGRWAFVGTRWGWVPGPVAVMPVYAPALVAFVGGGGVSVGIGIGGVGLAAWFPLGPRDPFIPWYHYGPTYLRQVNVTNVRNVTIINNYIHNGQVVNVNNIHYQNRTVAVTAVSGDTFRNGQPVAHSMVRVAPEQFAKAEVIAHPSITPARTAVFAGRAPVPAPPVRVARVTGPPPERGGPPAAKGMPPERPAPVVTRAEPSPAVRPASPAPEYRTAPRPAPGGPPEAKPTFITRTPPPPRQPSFEAREPAYQHDPGRPLEPQQVENLRQGKAAGPPRDREVLPHATPPPREQARPEAHPQAKPEKSERH